MSTATDRRDGAIRTRNRPSVPGAPFIPELDKAQPGGVATLDGSTSLVPTAQLGIGLADATKALFGDQSWKAAALSADLTAETNARVAADAAEAATRAAADTTLQTNITNEAATRAANDTAETNARVAADALLQPLSGKNAANGYAGLDAGSKVPVAEIPAHASTHNAGGTDALAIDAIAATGSLRTLGAGATQACAGNDARLSDSRAPTGAAGGELAGTYPNPTAKYVPHGTSTALSAADVDGPLATSFTAVIRDTTNGGTVVVIYENGQVPVLLTQPGGATVFVTGVAAAGQIQIKDRTGSGGIAFRANANRNNAALQWTTHIAQL